MKTPVFSFLFAVASVVTLPAAITITVNNYAPNGAASGGGGSGTGAFNTSLGTEASDNGMPVTTYTISNVDLTSEGGTATESFSFTVSYTATTDGTTAGTAQFNGFGNVSVTGGDNNQVNGTETLTATIGLTSSSFAGLSLTGFTSVRAGGVGTTETGTFTYAGGTGNVTFADRQPSVSGNSVTLSVASGSSMNFEGFAADFVAVPEPGTASLLGLGVFALLRRRRAA